MKQTKVKAKVLINLYLLILIWGLIFSLTFLLQVNAQDLDQEITIPEPEYTEESREKLNFITGEFLVKLKTEQKQNLEIQAESKNLDLSLLEPVNSENQVFKINLNSSSNRFFETQDNSEIRSKDEFSYKNEIRKNLDLQQKLEATGLFEIVAPENKYYPFSNDTNFGSQWHLAQNNDIDIDIQEAWSLERGSQDITIAIIDTTIDINHPDLINKIWINQGEIPTSPVDYVTNIDTAGDGDGLVESWEIMAYFENNGVDPNFDGEYNFDDVFHFNSPLTNGLDNDGNGYVDDIAGWSVFDNQKYNDEFGNHGTHVAGIAGAEADNNKYIAGVCADCLIMPVAIFNKHGAGGLSSYVIEAINYATNNGAEVINNSYGTEVNNALVEVAVNNAVNNDSVMVAAAGNQAVSTYYYPGSHDSVINVGASDRNDLATKFTNYNRTVDVLAPGEVVLSVIPNNGLAFFNGTSMASPVVAGIAGLLKAQNPSFTPQQIKQRIIAGSQNIQAQNNFSLFQSLGMGRVNAYNSLAFDTPEIDLENFDLTVNNAGNGFLEPNENANLNITIKNNGGAAATNINTTLTTSTPRVNLTNFSQTYTNLNPGQTNTQTFNFELEELYQRGEPVDLSLNITTAEGYLTTLAIRIPVGDTLNTLYNFENGMDNWYTRADQSLNRTWEITNICDFNSNKFSGNYMRMTRPGGCDFFSSSQLDPVHLYSPAIQGETEIKSLLLEFTHFLDPNPNIATDFLVGVKLFGDDDENAKWLGHFDEGDDTGNWINFQKIIQQEFYLNQTFQLVFKVNMFASNPNFSHTGWSIDNLRVTSNSSPNKAGLLITEINWTGSMANSNFSDEGQDEWIELYNNTNTVMDLTDLRINNLAGNNFYAGFSDPDIILKDTSGTDKIELVLDETSENNSSGFSITSDLSSTYNYCNNLVLEPQSYFLISRYEHDDAYTTLNKAPDCVIKAMKIEDAGEKLRLLDAGISVDLVG